MDGCSHIKQVVKRFSDYDTAGTISTQEVSELVETGQELFNELSMWLSKNYPQYL